MLQIQIYTIWQLLFKINSNIIKFNQLIKIIFLFLSCYCRFCYIRTINILLNGLDGLFMSVLGSLCSFARQLIEVNMTLTQWHYKLKHDSDCFTLDICEPRCFCYIVSRGYESPPKHSASRLESTARAFACGVLHLLKSKAICNGYINLDLDCWRYITQGKGTPSEHRGYFLFNKNDFGRLPMLPPDWWYCFNQHGEGKKVPMKIKPVIGWSPKKYVFDGKKVIPGPRFPIEKLSVSFARLPCNEKNLFN